MSGTITMERIMGALATVTNSYTAVLDARGQWAWLGSGGQAAVYVVQDGNGVKYAMRVSKSGAQREDGSIRIGLIARGVPGMQQLYEGITVFSEGPWDVWGTGTRILSGVWFCISIFGPVGISSEAFGPTMDMYDAVSFAAQFTIAYAGMWRKGVMLGDRCLRNMIIDPNTGDLIQIDLDDWTMVSESTAQELPPFSLSLLERAADRILPGGDPHCSIKESIDAVRRVRYRMSFDNFLRLPCFVTLMGIDETGYLIADERYERTKALIALFLR